MRIKGQQAWLVRGNVPLPVGEYCVYEGKNYQIEGFLGKSLEGGWGFSNYQMEVKDNQIPEDIILEEDAVVFNVVIGGIKIERMSLQIYRALGNRQGFLTPSQFAVTVFQAGVNYHQRTLGDKQKTMEKEHEA